MYTYIHDFLVWPRIQKMVDGAPICGTFGERADFTPGFWGTRPWQVLLRQGMLFWEIPWEIPCFHGGFNGNMSFCMVLGFCSQCDV